jgi:integrase
MNQMVVLQEQALESVHSALANLALARDLGISSTSSRQLNLFKQYNSDYLHFKQWTNRPDCPLPTSARIIVEYLKQYQYELSPATLSKRLAALRFIHKELLNHPIDPTQDQAVRNTLRDIKYERKHAAYKDLRYKKRQARPLTLSQTVDVLLTIPNTLRGVRDKAIIALAANGAFRVSELANLTHEQLVFDEKGLGIELETSKTDQLGEDQHTKAIRPAQYADICPVRALKSWIDESGHTEGILFRSITKQGEIASEDKPMTKATFQKILRSNLKRAGFEDLDKYSFHSFRAGFVTESKKLKASNTEIMQQTGHKEEATLDIYTRIEDAFEHNAQEKYISAMDRRLEQLKQTR